MLPNSELNILCYETQIFEEIKQWVIVIISKLKKVLKLLSVRMRGRFWLYICLKCGINWPLVVNVENSLHSFRVPL